MMGETVASHSTTMVRSCVVHDAQCGGTLEGPGLPDVHLFLGVYQCSPQLSLTELLCGACTMEGGRV